MATRIFIVRHAEHVAPSETHLSEVGSLQAASLAETFKSSKTKFDALYSSPRSIETAERIGASLGLTVTVDNRLRNWNAGVVTGLTKDQVKELHPDVFLHRYQERNPEYKVPDGESLDDRKLRVEEFLNQLVDVGPSPSLEPRQVIIVTHGGIIDDIFRIACKTPIPERTGLKKPFGCVSVVLYENGHWRDEEWARADHLPRVVAQSPSGGHLYLFPNQVSGSFPMLRGDRGELCKPATQNELSCYNVIFYDPPISPEIGRLREVVPRFLGTVEVDIASILHSDASPPPNSAASFPKPNSPSKASSLDSKEPLLEDLHITEDHGSVTSTRSSTTGGRFSMTHLWNRFVTDRWKKMVQSPQQDGSKRCVYMILENVTHGLIAPNVIDLKVGTRQHRDTETEDKQKRKAERCKQSTSATLGVRIHGVSMYSPTEKKMIMRDKYWGRSLDDQGVFSALAEFVSSSPTPDIIINQIVSRIELISEVVQGVQWRFWGSSILIVFDPTQRNPVTQVRLIDFGSCDMNENASLGTGFDQGFIFGLKNLSEGFQKALKTNN